MKAPNHNPRRQGRSVIARAERHPDHSPMLGRTAPSIVIAPASPNGVPQRLSGMRRDRPARGLGVAKRGTAKGNPRIEITPSASQYHQLCRDLAKLRSQGAASNTAAIIEAVHSAASAPILRRVSVKGRPKSRTGSSGG